MHILFAIIALFTNLEVLLHMHFVLVLVACTKYPERVFVKEYAIKFSHCEGFSALGSIDLSLN